MKVSFRGGTVSQGGAASLNAPNEPASGLGVPVRWGTC